jgi:hypothetical protein
LRHQASEAMYARTFICSGCGKRLFVAAVSRGRARHTLTRLRTLLTGWGLLLASLVLEVGLALLGYTAVTDWPSPFQDGQRLGVGIGLTFAGLVALVGVFLFNLVAERTGERKRGMGLLPSGTTTSTLTT